MRNTLKILMAGALMACAAFAQEKSESVEGILKELGGYQAKPAPVAGVADPGQPRPTDAATVAPVATAEPAPAVVTPVAEVADLGKAKEPGSTTPATVEPAATPAEVTTLVEESRDAYAGGEFEKAQAGFEMAVKLDPENMVARMYLRKLLERDARKVEVKAMKEVTGDWCTGLVLRSYDISAEAAEKMGLKDVKSAEDVSAKLPEVAFPKGATAIYQPKMGKLFVRNTRENLAVAEEILTAMDVANVASDVEQVEIEAKFVEVSEGTLEQLGFEWRTSGEAISLGNTDKVTIPDGQYLFDDALRGGPGNPNGMPFSRPNTLGAGSTGVSGDGTAFRMEDTFSDEPASMQISKIGGDEFDLLITALEQSTGTDMLSAPRVVTKSGKKATIRVGQMHYYPETYEAGASGGNIVHVKYTDWGERLLGVELDVEPQVDGEQIELTLNPKVLELQGWQNYEVAPADSAYTWYQYRIGFVFSHDDIKAQLPIFRKREIKTEVTIANGATMGMGGLINEKVEKYEDKVPVLGSIPLVGRLFRNEGERAIKRNLMIFVTAKKVTPSGRIETSRSFE